jgi:uncharacterized repeat protein (TIGR03843 family)
VASASTADQPGQQEPEFTAALVLPVEDALNLLTHGEMEVEGRLVAASNATLYCGVHLDGVVAACVYKPIAGERPLWDFPDGTLAEREVAAYEVSAAAGWNLVPPTVLRDGPAGPGMVQLWIDEDGDADLVALLRDHGNDQLRRMAVFDAVINNTDRKGGHILPTADGRIYGIDHGVSFHVDDKLRTVLWQWAGQRLPETTTDALCALRRALDGDLGQTLHGRLTRAEVRRLGRRIDRLLSSGEHPIPSSDWPPVPYPPM